VRVVAGRVRAAPAWEGRAPDGDEHRRPSSI